MEGNFNFWSITLLISIAQGVILILMLTIRQPKNVVASRVLLFLIAAIMAVNFDYFLMSSSLYKVVPGAIGISLGLMYAFGPLFYFYMRSIADSTFKWRHVYFLHFSPLIIRLLLNWDFYQLDNTIKQYIVDAFLQGKSPTEGLSFYSTILFQIIHLCIYLIFSYRFLQKEVKENNHLVPIPKRIGWLKSLFYSNLVFVLSFVSWFLISSIQSVSIPYVDFTSTLVCSAMVFLIGFKLVLTPEIVTPNFDKKYKSSSLNLTDSQRHLDKLQELMVRDKMYTEPDLKLNEVADQLSITTHILSQIINEKFGKSFLDFVNEYRVEAFKKRLAESNGDKVNLLSLAMEVGFNSKSAFNAAFKKISDQTPTEYKKSLKSRNHSN